MKKKNQKAIDEVATQVFVNADIPPHQEKREKLKELSKQVKPLVDDETYATVNAAIIDRIYRTENHQTFKSFNEWLAEGFKVKKGEKAFVIWGKPLKAQKNSPEEVRYDFFPLSYIFSNAQVEPSKKEAQS